MKKDNNWSEILIKRLMIQHKLMIQANNLNDQLDDQN